MRNKTTLYEECQTLLKNEVALECTNDLVDDDALVIVEDSISSRSTFPVVLNQKDIPWNDKTVFYISDLHLAHHLLTAFPDGASNEEAVQYIRTIVSQLFQGEFYTEVSRFRSPTVLFGGDISSSFKLAALFYQIFIETWKSVETESYEITCEKCAPLEEERAQCEEQINEWMKKHPWAHQATKPLEEYKSVPRKIKTASIRKQKLSDQIDECLQGFSDNWKTQYHTCPGKGFIYTVLGNHEFWDFASYEECVDAYAALFTELKITFLNSSIVWLGDGDFSVGDTPYLESIRPHPRPWSNDLLLVGGVGYAIKNDAFNASKMIYNTSIDAAMEKKLCEEWRKVFSRAEAIAKNQGCSLVVLSHMPFSDWGSQMDDVTNTIFFSGHTHRNLNIHKMGNTHYFADNQVGYRGRRYTLKKAILHKPRNPFAGDPDGYREITISEYTDFYIYMHEGVPGTGTIELQMREYGGALFMVKQEGYYGFFFSSPKGCYICNGGRLKKISKSTDMKRINAIFPLMVNYFIEALMPLRKAQEQISGIVVGIGGTGDIHGCIVDIDFYNHVMINPIDGTITFYYSPIMGVVKTYPSLRELLIAQCPALMEKHSEHDLEKLVPMGLHINRDNEDEYVKVDIKNSPYKLSRRVNALQRIFDKHILRDWNVEALFKSLMKQTNTPDNKTPKLPESIQ